MQCLGRARPAGLGAAIGPRPSLPVRRRGRWRGGAGVPAARQRPIGRDRLLRCECAAPRWLLGQARSRHQAIEHDLERSGRRCARSSWMLRKAVMALSSGSSVARTRDGLSNLGSSGECRLGGFERRPEGNSCRVILRASGDYSPDATVRVRRGFLLDCARRGITRVAGASVRVEQQSPSFARNRSDENAR
jgi:hypothetical protein